MVSNSKGEESFGMLSPTFRISHVAGAKCLFASYQGFTPCLVRFDGYLSPTVAMWICDRGKSVMNTPVLEEAACEAGAPNIWELVLRNAGHNSIAGLFMSESKAVGERLLAHNASDKDKLAVAHFLYHTGVVSIQVQPAVDENKCKVTGFVPGDEDSRQRISPGVDVGETTDNSPGVTAQSSVDYPTNPPGTSKRYGRDEMDGSDDISLISTGVDVKVDTKDDNPGVTAQSSVQYPTNPPGTSMRNGSGAMDDDDSDDNGYALWDQDPQNEEEETPKENATPNENSTIRENADGLDRTDGGVECLNCHTKFMHTWDFDIHQPQCPAPSVYACNQCDHIRHTRDSIIRHLRKVHNVPLAEILAKIQDLRIPKSDIVNMKIQIRTNSTVSRRRDQKKSYACDRCDFTHNGQEPIIKHLQEEHELTLAETLSKYRELEVPVSKMETGKQRSKRALKSHEMERSGKVRKGDMKNNKKRRTTRSSRNCDRTSPSNTSQTEECSDTDIVMDLFWKNTMQDHELVNGNEGDCRIPPEKLELQTLSIKLQDIRKKKEYITFEVKSEVDPVEHTKEITLSTTEHMEMSKEMEAKPEEIEDGEQTQAGEEAVTEISPTETSEAVTSNSSNSTQNKGRKKQNQCDICGENFKSHHSRMKHIHVEHFRMTYTCSTCNKVFDTHRGLQSHVKSMHKNKADDIVYKCEICLKTFYHQSSYIAHKYLHEDKYACEVCGKRFRTRGSMEAHLNRVHTKDKLFPCDICDKVYYDKKTLMSHMEYHSDRKYECDICHQKFHHNWLVNLHKRNVHTEKSHLCEICGKSFKSKGTLSQHCDTVHSTKCRYKCDVCGRGFKRSSILYAHQRTHTDIKPYPCEICGKNFRTRRHLQVHTNWHNNVRDFVCEACGKTFLTKTNLDKHCFTHTGRKPHPCTECEQEFVDLPSLRHHLLKKHDIHLERKVPRKSSVVKMTEPPQTQDPPSAEQEPQVKSGSSAPGTPSTQRTVVEPVNSSVVSGQPAQFDVVSSAVTASGISDMGLKTAEQVSEDLQPPAMTAQSLPQHSSNIDDNMIATEALMQIIMS
ncbi:uncharacterized protein [Diadema antillarum]|uniref:uncharacterized protein n=1 Tax=Diadema antillarum TaxID=105358 RepID=UPI003A8425B8